MNKSTAILTLRERLLLTVQNSVAGRGHHPFFIHNFLECNYTKDKGLTFWIDFGKFVIDYDDNHGWEFIPIFAIGKLWIARTMSLQEQEDYQSELEFMEQEANRYTEWSY